MANEEILRSILSSAFCHCLLLPVQVRSLGPRSLDKVNQREIKNTTWRTIRESGVGLGRHACPQCCLHLKNQCQAQTDRLCGDL